MAHIIQLGIAWSAGIIGWFAVVRRHRMALQNSEMQVVVREMVGGLSSSMVEATTLLNVSHQGRSVELMTARNAISSFPRRLATSAHRAVSIEKASSGLQVTRFRLGLPQQT